MTANRRTIALATLLGLLALPVLGMLSGDACCAGASPCAPGAAPCTSLGATPCCDADRGAAGAVDLGAWTASLALLAPAGWLTPLDGARDAGRRRVSEASSATSALRLSVVLRI